MDWHMELVGFVPDFPQAPISTYIYMRPPKVPKGFKIPDLKHPTDAFTKIYMLLKKLYVIKDAGST